MREHFLWYAFFVLFDLLKEMACTEALPTRSAHVLTAGSNPRPKGGVSDAGTKPKRPTVEPNAVCKTTLAFSR